MKSYALTDPQKGLIVYRDRKRLLWLGSLLYPVFSFSGIGLYLMSGSEWMLLVPILATYIGIPVLDWLAGEDPSNPPEELVPALEADAGVLDMSRLRRAEKRFRAAVTRVTSVAGQVQSRARCRESVDQFERGDREVDSGKDYPYCKENPYSGTAS